MRWMRRIYFSLMPLHCRPSPHRLNKERTGPYGESVAASFLKSKGYKILVRNYKCKWGELDIVCRHLDTLVFVEVKTRGENSWGKPSEAVTASKQRRMIHSAAAYLKELECKPDFTRFDVVEIELADGETPRVHLIEQAFVLEASNLGGASS